MVLAHIALGLDLAISSQPRCYVIIDSNRYLGFSLLGARFAIFDNTKWVAPYSNEIFRSDLVSLDPHAAAVAALTSKLGELAAIGIYTGPGVTEKSFDSPEGLIPILGGLNLQTVGDDEVELNTLLRSLIYMGDGYIQRNPQAVAEILETIFYETVIIIKRHTTA